YECSHCEIVFRNCVMYTMHMGYHGYHNPLKCNMCGYESKDQLDFFLHIARVAHE
ncbi:Protein hunchback, partial [Lamellibrachia satsuma]